ncbi:hypothetical protein CI102_15078 [Trichoderma harzianum]|nr:hypothetical protein CI102_15078 [Trichoderma harzianum]
MAPTFRRYPQLRDAYLIPLRDHASVREKYTTAGGNSFLKRSANSLRIKNGEIFQFNFWGVAFDGRVCIVIGNLPNDSRPGAWTRTDFKNAHGAEGLNLLDSIRACFGHPKLDRYTGKHRIRAAEVRAIQLDLEERGPPVALETQMESETAALQRQIRPLDMRYELRSGRYQPPQLKAAYEPDTALRALGAPLTANVLAAGIRNVLDEHAPQSSEESAAMVQQVGSLPAKQYELLSDALKNVTPEQFYEFMKRGHQEMALKLGLLQTTQSSPNAPAIQSSGAPAIQVSGTPAIQSSGVPANQSSDTMDTTE